MAAKKKGNQKKAKNKAKKVKAEGGGDAAQAQRNPKAFSFQSANKAKSARARSAEKEQKRLHGGNLLGLMHAVLCALSAEHLRACSSYTCITWPPYLKSILVAAPLAQALECDLPPPMVVLVQGPPGWAFVRFVGKCSWCCAPSTSSLLEAILIRVQTTQCGSVNRALEERHKQSHNDSGLRQKCNLCLPRHANARLMSP
eukprot:899825-Pelagomonas_calceolata.AAC.3